MRDSVLNFINVGLFDTGVTKYIEMYSKFMNLDKT